MTDEPNVIETPEAETQVDQSVLEPVEGQELVYRLAGPTLEKLKTCVLDEKMIDQLIQRFIDQGKEKIKELRAEARALWAEIFAAAGLDQTVYEGVLDTSENTVTFTEKAVDEEVGDATLNSIVKRLLR